MTEQQKYFIELFKRYLIFYGMLDWSITYRISKESEEGTKCDITIESESMCATLSLNDKYIFENNEEINSTVKHEIGHLLVGQLVDNNVTTPQEEALANRMEVILKDLPK